MKSGESEETRELRREERKGSTLPRGKGWRCWWWELWLCLRARMRVGPQRRAAYVLGLCSGAQIASRRPFGARDAAEEALSSAQPPPSSGTGSFHPAKSLIYRASLRSPWKYLRLLYNSSNSLLIYSAPSLPPPFLFLALSRLPGDLCALFPTRKLLFREGNAWGRGREEREQQRG